MSFTENVDSFPTFVFRLFAVKHRFNCDEEEGETVPLRQPRLHSFIKCHQTRSAADDAHPAPEKEKEHDEQKHICIPVRQRCCDVRRARDQPPNEWNRFSNAYKDSILAQKRKIGSDNGFALPKKRHNAVRRGEMCMLALHCHSDTGTSTGTGIKCRRPIAMSAAAQRQHE